MKVPYRCPKCHALLARDTELAETFGFHSDVYVCSVCGHLMNGSEVESGRFDVKVQPPASRNHPAAGPQALGELLVRLRSEHREGYVYRGQTKKWSAPLVPSLYRGKIDNKTWPDWNPTKRLREVGSTFYEELANDKIVLSPTLLRRFQTNQYLNQLFGYPLGQVLAQQCGITSEGLDVTTDPDVAAFFAIFDFQTGQFAENGTGVIYRFSVDPEKSKQLKLDAVTFYDCPPYLDAKAVLSQIKQCDSWESARESFLQYNIAYHHAVASQGVSAARPLGVLSLPTDDLALARVVQQRAGLLFPDMILSQIYRTFGKQPPPGKADKTGENAVEDISSRAGGAEFLFNHSAESRFTVPHSPQVVFPKRDPFLEMLKYFLGGIGMQYIFLTELGPIGQPEGFVAS